MVRILAGVKGFGLPPHPGGGSVSRSLSSLLGCGGASVRPSLWGLRPSLPAACPPAKNRPSVGLELGFVRPSMFLFPWGFYYIACLRTLSSGEQRAKIFIPFARPFAYLLQSLCTSFAILLPVLCEDGNRLDVCNHLSVQKNTAFVGSCLCVLFLLFSI